MTTAEKNTLFKELVVKYLTHDITDSELDQLKTYLDAGREFRRYFDRENEIWQISDSFKNHSNQIENSWNGIERIISKNSSPVVILSKRKASAILIAAGITLLAGLSFFLLTFNKTGVVESTAVSNIEIRTDEGEKASILLSDSTMVLLNSGSILNYDNINYDNKRIVKLQGEAYFDVHTNPEKPFLVQLDKMTITATGTRFNVFSYENDNRIEATLEEGEITVTTMNDNKTHIVKPGQQAVFFNNTSQTLIRNVNTETYTSWKENKLRLIDTPMEEALRRIARKYNVVFEIRGSKLLDLRYTATFIDESVDEVMRMLETVSPISYKIQVRTSVNDKQYLKPKIIISERK